MKCISCGGLLDERRPDCPHCGHPRSAPPHRDGDEVAVRTVRLGDLLLGRYRLEAKIGEGGMGTVYLAHDKELDRRVAVKLLASAYAGDREVVERFEREARLTARLDHPNIVPVYDVGSHDGRPFMVMKKLEGQSLAGVLRERGGFTRDETLALFRQLAAGVDFIHGQGFIHRDIKAGNIFVGPDGQATLLDFGILRPARGNEALTRTGMVMGTPHYMAPEQALGSKNVDHRVDLYALGVVIFECLSGTLPFEADSELRLIQMQAHQPAPDLLERAPWIPRPVAEVMRRALSKSPDERFPSAGELVKALDGAWSARVQPALPATVLRRDSQVSESTAPSLRTLENDAPSPRVAPLASSAAHGGPPAAPPPSGPGAGPEALPPQPNTSELENAVRKSRRTPVVVLGLLLVAVAAGTYFALAPPEGLGPGAQAQVDAGAAGGVAPAGVADAGGEALALAAPDAGQAAGEEDDAGTALAAVDPFDAGEDEPEGADAGPVRLGKRPPGRGKLNVLTSYNGEPFWAQVSIDGVDKGRTPLFLDLPQGSYRVRVERPGFRAESRQIWVASGRPSVVRINLKE